MQTVDEHAQARRVGLVLERHEVDDLGRGHQPDASAHHCAQIGLHQQAAHIGRHSPLAHIVIVYGLQAVPRVQRETDQPGGLSAASAISPAPRSGQLQMVIELLVGHAGFVDGMTQLFSDLDDPVHAREDDGDASVARGRPLTIAPVLARADGPDRRGAGCCNLKNSLHLGHQPGVHLGAGQRAHCDADAHDCSTASESDFTPSAPPVSCSCCGDRMASRAVGMLAFIGWLCGENVRSRLRADHDAPRSMKARVKLRRGGLATRAIAAERGACWRAAQARWPCG